MPAPLFFAQQVRHALTHLYDPDILRGHPLLGPFGLSGHANPQAALREVLGEGIEALRPPPTVPVGSRAWRIYRVLVCRYVQQLDQEQTAHQLGVGVRHVRREQHAAVDALADHLYQKVGAAAGFQRANRDTTTAAIEDELVWLKAMDVAGTGAVDVLLAAVRLVGPLASARDVRLEMADLPPLPPVALHPAALRQAMVSALSCAIRRVLGGIVKVAAEETGREIVVTITAVIREIPPAGSEEWATSLAALRALLTLEGGRLDTREDRAAITLALAVPVADSIEVLLIDDNADFAQLFQRYVAGTRYRLRWAPGASGFFDTLTDRRPNVVVLDVMIPEVDGWEILGRLRQHPLTSHLPILICSILPERELALALGATDFLAKPVTRQALLSALRTVLGEPAPKPS